MPDTKQAEVDKKWQIEADVRIIQEYADLCKDKKRMSAAQKMLEEKQRETNKILKSEMWKRVTA